MTNEYLVLSNMYYNNTVSKDNMATIKIQDYLFEITREEVKSEFMDLQYRYRCNLVIKNLIGTELKRLCFNELQASQMLDSINTFVYNDYTDMYILSGINSPSNIYESYSIYLKTIDETKHLILFQVTCKIAYNNVPVISIIMNIDELDELSDAMFFIYLIDIVSERSGIFST